MEYIDDINDAMDTIPYMFEGNVFETEVFAGDDNGEPVPFSSATWSGDFGFWPGGAAVYGYSRTKIHVCKIYKGDLTGDSDLDVLTRSFQISGLYLQRIDNAVQSDTLVRYVFKSADHDDYGQMKVFLPSEPTRKLFICTRIDDIATTDYSGKPHHSNFESYLEIPFNVPVDIENPDGSMTRTTAYAALFPYIFETQSELEYFLSFISSINPTPTDHCPLSITVTDVAKSVFENPAIYPNPAHGSFNVDLSSTSELTVTDLTGRLVRRFSASGKCRIDNLIPGVYILQISSANGLSTTKLISR